MQLEAGLTRQFGFEGGQVELRERELLFKPRLLVAAIDQTGLTTIEFVRQERAEGIEERLAGALGLQDTGLERVGYARYPQLSRQRSISGKSWSFLWWLKRRVDRQSRSRGEPSRRRIWMGLRRRRERGLVRADHRHFDGPALVAGTVLGAEAKELAVFIRGTDHWMILRQKQRELGA